MKKALLFLLCCTLVFSCCGCAEDDVPREITVLTWSDYIPPETVKEFTEETGIKVNYVTAETNEEIIEKVTADPAAYDLIIATDYAMNMLVQNNLLQEIDYDDFANYKYVSGGYTGKYYDPESKYTVPYSTAGILIGYDSQKAGIYINSFADLLAPELENSVVFVDDSSAVVGIANMILNKNPEYGEDLNDTAKILQALANNRYDPPEDIQYIEDALANGDAAAGVLFTSQLGYVTAVNPNVEIVYPKEGFIYSIDAMAIPAGADGAKFAVEFMNYVHDPVNNGKIMQEICCSTTNISGIQFMDAEYRDSEGYNIKNDKAEEGILFPQLDEKTQKLFDSVYKSEFKGRGTGEPAA